MVVPVPRRSRRFRLFVVAATFSVVAVAVGGAPASSAAAAAGSGLSGGCDDAGVSSGSGGFDEAYSVDLIGRLSSWTTAASTLPVVRSFVYGDVAHPDAPTSNGVLSVSYDANGSAQTRGGVVLSWDALHRLVGIAGTQANVYGNDGTRLLRTDLVAGSVTLFLPGQQVTGPVGAGAVTGAVRSYSLDGVSVATRTGGGSAGVFWECGQRQGSVACSSPIGVGSSPVVPGLARYRPYGSPRAGSAVLSGTERGFVGQITDVGGLAQLGQRVYDPGFGHFLSVDPLTVVTGDPYLYAAGNPITMSDPNGLDPGDVNVIGFLGDFNSTLEKSKTIPVNQTTAVGVGKCATHREVPECGRSNPIGLLSYILTTNAIRAGEAAWDGNHLMFLDESYGAGGAIDINGLRLTGIDPGVVNSAIGITLMGAFGELFAEGNFLRSLNQAARVEGSMTNAYEASTRAGIDRGDGRDVYGRFTGRGGYGASAEGQGLAEYTTATGREAIGTQVRATLPDGSIRYYDGLSVGVDGMYQGIEVKSGSASLTASQRAFDAQVNGGVSATAILNGTQISISSTYLVRVP